MHTDDGKSQHVLLGREPTKSHAPDDFERAAGSLQQAGLQCVEAKPLDQAGGKVSNSAVQDAGAGAHRQKEIGAAVEEGFFDLCTIDGVFLDPHLVLRHSPHGHHFFILGQHFGVVRTIRKV